MSNAANNSERLRRARAERDRERVVGIITI